MKKINIFPKKKKGQLKKILKKMSKELTKEFLTFGFLMIENTAYYKILHANPILTPKQKKEIKKNYLLYCEKLTQFLSEFLLEDQKNLPLLRSEVYDLKTEIRKKVDEWLPIHINKMNKKPIDKGDYYT